MKLEPYLQRFSDRLFSVHPEWRRFAKSVKDWRGSDILVVEVPAPNPRATRGLEVLTEGNSIIVGFDAWHTHFEQSEEQAFELAEGVIADLVSERLVAVSYWSGDSLRLAAGSDLIEPPLQPP